jgi:hypothetical protein
LTVEFILPKVRLMQTFKTSFSPCETCGQLLTAAAAARPYHEIEAVAALSEHLFHIHDHELAGALGWVSETLPTAREAELHKHLN